MDKTSTMSVAQSMQERSVPISNGHAKVEFIIIIVGVEYQSSLYKISFFFFWMGYNRSVALL